MKLAFLFLLVCTACIPIGDEFEQPDAGPVATDSAPADDGGDVPNVGGPSADVLAPVGVSATDRAEVRTLSGRGAGFLDGNAAVAQFRSPEGIGIDDAGNVIIADSGNYRLRRLSPTGLVNTVAGSGVPGANDGPKAVAELGRPEGVTADPTGGVWFADAGNHAIRRVSADGFVETVVGAGVGGFLDGDIATAMVRSPGGLAVDRAGNLIVADTGNHAIRRVSTAGFTETLAGTGDFGFLNGDAQAALLNSPEDVAIAPSGDILFADAANHSIRRISLNGYVDTLAGTAVEGFVDGEAINARFRRPEGLAVDSAGNVLVADTLNHAIRMLTPNGLVVTIAGNGFPGAADGPGELAQFSAPSGAALDGAGNLVVCDEQSHRVRLVVGGGPGRLGIRWSPMADRFGDRVQGYRAFALSPDEPARTCETRFEGTSCTIAGLTSGSIYSVVVVAMDRAGVLGPASTPVMATAP